MVMRGRMQIRSGAKNTAEFLITILIPIMALFLTVLFLGPSNVYGEEVGLGVNITKTDSMAIILGGAASEGSIAIDVTPNGLVGTFGESDDFTATVITSNELGYTLNMARSSGAMVAENIENDFVINELESSDEGYTSDDFPTNKWGYASKTGNDYGNFFGIGDGVLLQESSEATNGTTSTLKLGTKINYEVPEDTYSTVITFTATAKVDSKLYMQDVAQWKSRLSVNESIIATDLRDMKDYWVTRLAVDPNIPDGRADCTGIGIERVCTQVWMTQNLDLELDTETVFTHANTDLGWTNDDENVIWTPVVATTSTISEYSNTATADRSFDPGDKYYYYVSSATNDTTYNSLEACANAGHTEDECKHYHAGNYYNFYSAAALNATSGGTKVSVSNDNYTLAPNSVCPAGWKLSTGATSENGYSDFDYLVYQNGLSTSHTIGDVNAVWSTSGFNNMRTEPFWFVRSGRTTNGSLSSPANFGLYWTNSIQASDKAYYMYFDSPKIIPANFKNRYFGGSVRCVAREAATGEGPMSYIQDIIDMDCPTSPTVVIDKRDNERYTIQQLADGRCWMLDNLRLDLTNSTVQARLNSDTTNASNTTLGYLKGTTTRDPSNDPDGQYATAGVAAWTSSYSYSAPLIGTASKYTPVSYAMGQSGTGNIGIYYNYCAATAGSYCYGYGENGNVVTSSGNATEDICPKGWRIPTGGSSGEYQALYTAYSGDGAAFVNALRVPLSGYFDTASAYNQGSDGYFWSSTRNSNLYMYGLDVDTSNINPQDYSFNRRSDGGSVRCIAEKPDYIQDVTADTCTTTPRTVVDKRDGEEYLIGRLSDGNCWLLDNLRLDPLDSTVRGRMSSSNTNASDTAINSFKYGGGTASDQYAMYPVANGASDSKYATPLVNTKNKNKTGVSYAGKYGVHYNFCAASAGSYCYGNDNSSDDDELTGNPTEDATEDICPKGWRLPTGGPSGEYQALYAIDSANYKTILHLPYSGYSGDGSTDVVGIFWSSTRSGNFSSSDQSKYTMYTLWIGSSASTHPSYYSQRFNDYSVRCLLKN